MFTRLFLLFLLPTLPLSSAVAQSTAPVSSPAAVTLATRALLAVAGPTALNDVTLQAYANVILGSDKQNGPAGLVARGNGQSLVALNLSGGRQQEVRNVTAGVWVGPNGVPQGRRTRGGAMYARSRKWPRHAKIQHARHPWLFFMGLRGPEAHRDRPTKRGPASASSKPARCPPQSLALRQPRHPPKYGLKSPFRFR
jgi:hypothetical protein